MINHSFSACWAVLRFLDLKRLVPLILVLAASLNAVGMAQSNSVYKILDIIVEGNVYADRATIIALSGLREGEEVVIDQANVLQNEKIQNAVSKLWGRKQFDRIAITVDKLTPLGIVLKIVVVEYPRLNEIVISGNDDISSEDIRLAIAKYRGDILRDYDGFQAAKRVRELYEEEGRPFTEVSYAIEATDTANYSRLVIDIEEGNDFFVQSIFFEGNNAFSDDELISALDEVNTKSWWQFWRSDKFDLEEYETGKKNLIAFYRRNGYLDATLVNDSVAYNNNHEAVQLHFTVTEGQQVYVRSIDFEGNVVYPNERLKQRLDFEEGDVFDEERFNLNLKGNENQTDVASLYLDNGYLMVDPQSDIRRIGNDSVDILIRIRENNQFTVRRVDIKGNTKTHDKVVRRELFVRPGDYFNRSAIIRSIRGLGVLNYFNPETLRPEINRVDNSRVDVAFNVEERSSDTFNASVGFAGSFGITGSIGVTLNNFSISEPLTGGAGQVFRFEWQFGGSNSLRTFTLGFTEPWVNDEPLTFGFNLFDSRQRSSFDIRRTGVSVNIGRRLSWPDDWFRLDYQLRYLRNDIRDDGTGTSTGLSTEISLRQSISRTNLDNILFPSEGSRFSFATQYAFGSLGIGSTDYFKNDITFEQYNPLMKIGGFNRLVLYLSSQWGYVVGFESDTTIPPTEIYRMGGNGLGGFAVTPLRGYQDEDIGPRNENGNIIGGRFMTRYVAELRFALSLSPMPIYLLGFAEAGNVWTGLSTSDPFDLKRSAGLGMRILLQPIGLLGFDYGFGFDPVGESGDRSGWQFHFQFGR